MSTRTSATVQTEIDALLERNSGNLAKASLEDMSLFNNLARELNSLQKAEQKTQQATVKGVEPEHMNLSEMF